MAVQVNVQCLKCGETSYEVVPDGVYPTTCSKCLDKEASLKKITHLKGLEALTLKKRIALIEEYIYDDKARYKGTGMLT